MGFAFWHSVRPFSHLNIFHGCILLKQTIKTQYEQKRKYLQGIRACLNLYLKVDNATAGRTRWITCRWLCWAWRRPQSGPWGAVIGWGLVCILLLTQDLRSGFGFLQRWKTPYISGLIRLFDIPKKKKHSLKKFDVCVGECVGCKRNINHIYSSYIVMYLTEWIPVNDAPFVNISETGKWDTNWSVPLPKASRRWTSSSLRSRGSSIPRTPTRRRLSFSTRQL